MMRGLLAFSMVVATLATSTTALAAPSDGSWAALSALTSTTAHDRNDEDWRLYNRCVRRREYPRDAVRGQDYADERTDPMNPRRIRCRAVAGAWLAGGALLPVAMIVSTGVLDIVLLANQANERARAAARARAVSPN